MKFWTLARQKCAPMVNAKDRLEMATGVREEQGHCLEKQSSRRRAWLSSMERPLLKRQRAGQAVVVHLFGPHAQEAEAGGQPGLQELQNSQGYEEKPCPKKTKRKGRKDGQVLTEMWGKETPPSTVL